MYPQHRMHMCRTPHPMIIVVASPSFPNSTTNSLLSCNVRVTQAVRMNHRSLNQVMTSKRQTVSQRHDNVYSHFKKSTTHSIEVAVWLFLLFHPLYQDEIALHPGSLVRLSSISLAGVENAFAYLKRRFQFFNLVS